MNWSRTSLLIINIILAFSLVLTPLNVFAQGPPPGSIVSFTFSPASVSGGTSSTGTIIVSPAPTAPTTVNLSSTNNAVASVPASVTVPPGATSVTFPVTTFGVTTVTNVPIIANYVVSEMNSSITVTPVGGSTVTVSLNPASVTGGSSSTGTVTISPTSSTVTSISLSSSNTAVGTVPSMISIPAGSASATFTVSTTAVSSSTQITIGASNGSVQGSAILTVNPVTSGLTLNLNPASIIGGNTSTGTVTLSAPASSNTAITLSSSNPSVVTTPSSVTVLAGSATATFSATSSTITTSTQVTLTASQGSTQATAVLTVNPSSSSINLSLNPTSVIGGASSTGTVTLLPAPTSNVTVAIASSNSTVATIPTTLTIPAGSTSATFPVTTTSVSAVTNATISVTYQTSTATATLTVDPPISLTNFTLSSSQVTGGGNESGTVTLSGNAPTGGILVSLISNNTAATVPATVTVYGNSNSATFPITTTGVTANTSVTITATLGSQSLSQTFTIIPPQLQLFSINPSTCTGGTVVNGTASLDGVAPTGGEIVSVTCNTPGAIQPVANQTIAAGQTSVTFPIQTTWVNEPVTAMVSATVLGQIDNSSITLNPANLRVTSITPPNQLVLKWDVYANGPDFILQRNGTTIATIPSSQHTYTDTVTPGQVYLYSLYDTTMINGVLTQGLLLTQEKCEMRVTPATEDQAVDSRIDPRYSTIVYMDHCFGNTTFHGGLFVGYVGDPAKIGRSFINFPTIGPPVNGATFRYGAVAAYSTYAYTTQNSPVTVAVGCQALSDTTWNASTLTWTTQPEYGVLNPSADETVDNITYNPSTGPAGWQNWMLSEIRTDELGGGPLSVALIAPNENTTGWMYFAKLELGAGTAPSLVDAWDMPIPLKVFFTPASISQAGNSIQYTIDMNGIGINDSATVQVSMSITYRTGWTTTTPPEPIYTTVYPNSNVIVTGLSHTETINLEPYPGVKSITINVTCNGVSAGAVTQP